VTHQQLARDFPRKSITTLGSHCDMDAPLSSGAMAIL